MKHGNKKVVDCAGIALVNSGRVFLIRPMFNGIVQKYGFPKGHVESGEDMSAAAEREFTEETGISIEGREKTRLGSVYAKVDDGSLKRVTIFRVNGDGSETFKSSNMCDNGLPENIGGNYVSYETAYDSITTYQKPLIKKLMDEDKSSFGNFLNNRMG